MSQTVLGVQFISRNFAGISSFQTELYITEYLRVYAFTILEMLIVYHVVSNLLVTSFFTST